MTKKKKMFENYISKLFDAKEGLNSNDLSDVLIEIDDVLRKKIQSELLKMYKDILRVCTKYHIIPYLSGGSALGAVRHKGFIPWDDDMDLVMTRKDFQKFASIFENELSDNYILCAPNYSNKVKGRFPKIIKKGTVFKEAMDSEDDEYNGLFLDIFIAEGVPDNKLYRRIKGNYCNLLMLIAGQVAIYEGRGGTLKKVYVRMGKLKYYIRIWVGFLFSFWSAKKWFELVDKSVRYNRKNTKQICFPTGRKHYFGEILDKERLFPAQYVEFEDIKAPVFKDVDYYLSNLYGDYMRIPSEENREKHFMIEISI